MSILVKLHYAKFDLFRLFCSKVIEEKSLGKEGLRQLYTSFFKLKNMGIGHYLLPW